MSVYVCVYVCANLYVYNKYLCLFALVGGWIYYTVHIYLLLINVFIYAEIGANIFRSPQQLIKIIYVTTYYYSPMNSYTDNFCVTTACGRSGPCLLKTVGEGALLSRELFTSATRNHGKILYSSTSYCSSWHS